MRLGEYPLPSYAAYIWHSGDALHILMPPSTEGGKSNTIRIPLERTGVEHNQWGQPLPSQRGWKFLLDTLLARSTSDQFTIGTPAAPTQYDLDEIVRHWSGQVTKIERKKDAPEELTIDDLDILAD